MIVYKDKMNCCGCSACMTICPQNCISMKADAEGFLYPVIDNEKCTNCGMCVNHCPLYEDNYKLYKFGEPDVYALIHKEQDVVNKSTSGGAFTAILQAIGFENTVIFGATMDENQIVRHICIEDPEQVEKLRKSKYVQSVMGDSYRMAKKYLELGKKVVFSGTPCQISGLKASLFKQYNNLYTVEVLCHGVPSPLFFEKYKSYISKKRDKVIKSIDFRDKSDINWERFKIKVIFDDDTSYKKVACAAIDPFFVAYTYSLCLRPSCGSCKFVGIPRQADFLIADFWGAYKIKPKVNFRNGVSLLLCNSLKAKEMIPSIERFATILPSNLEIAAAENPRLFISAVHSPRRDDFFADLSNIEFADLVKKYLRIKSFAYQFAGSFLSAKQKNQIRKIMRLIRRTWKGNNRE